MIFEQNIYPDDIQEKLDSIDLIQKGFDLGIVSSEVYKASLESLEKAKKDISKLKTIKKIIQRDGKSFLATYHVKYGEEKEDKKKTVEVHADTPLTHIGENIKLKLDDGKTIRGVVHKISPKGRHGVTQLFLETGPGVFRSITVSKIKSFAPAAFEEKSKTVASKISKPAVFPEFKDLKLVEKLGGSGDNMLMTDADKNFWVVKKERAGVSGQLRNEFLADDLYNKMGFEAPESRMIYGPGGTVVKISPYTEGIKELGTLPIESRGKAYAEIRKGFVMDCLLANWDVIGANMDNILCSSDGSRVIRIDNGGSLRYRAKGDPKGVVFGEEVTEIDVFRSDKNPTAKAVFGVITDGEIKEQIKEIRNNFGKIKERLEFYDVSLSSLLEKRLENLEERFISGKPKKAVKPAGPVLRSDMPSLTTQKYFDNGWDELELDGESNLKESIKTQIINIENKFRSQLENWAKNAEMEYDAYLDKLQETVDKVVTGSECFIAVHTGAEGKDVLSQILSSGGKFKSLFETGTSSGSTSMHARARTENKYFGFPNDTAHKSDKRPIYGYFTPHGDGVINSEGTIPPPNHTDMYGDASFKLKKSSALKKATVTFEDSLGGEFNMASTPYAKPHFTSLLNTFRSDPIYELEKNFREKKNLGEYNYVECQYHGGLSIKDLESVHVSPEMYGRISSPEGRKRSFNNMNKTINKINSFVAETGHKGLKIQIF